MKGEKQKDDMDIFFENRFYYESLIPFEENGKWGYQDEKGTVVIKPQYDAAFFFVGSSALVMKRGKLYEIDYNGKTTELISYFFDEGLEPIKSIKYPDKYGYIDKSGRFVIEPQFKEANSFREGLALVCIEVSYVLTDNNGSYRMEPEHAFRHSRDTPGTKPQWRPYMHKGQGIMGDNYGFIDKTGDFVVPPLFWDAEEFSEELALVQTGTGYGYIDKNCVMICKPEFCFAYGFNEGFGHICITEDEHGFTNDHGYVNKKGEIVSRGYQGASDFSEGLAGVKQNNGWVFINKHMVVEIKGPFEDVFYFSEGIAAVKINGKWGFINTKGEIIIAPKFDMPSSYINGVLDVPYKGKIVKFDKQGNEITD